MRDSFMNEVSTETKELPLSADETRNMGLAMKPRQRGEAHTARRRPLGIHVLQALGAILIGAGLMVVGGVGDTPSLGVRESAQFIAAGFALAAAGAGLIAVGEKV